MPLTQAQEDRDYELRIEQMTTNIEKLRNDIKYESRKFAVQLVAGVAVSLGAGAAIATYVNNRWPAQPPVQPVPQIIVIPYPAPAAPTHP
jgi:hypothetical protein